MKEGKGNSMTDQDRYENFTQQNEDAATRRIVREEIARNYRLKGGLARGLALVLAGALLGAGGGAALVASGNVPLPAQYTNTATGTQNGTQKVQISLKEVERTV